MTPKEIMKMDPEARLALEARARVGEADAIRDWMLSAAWRDITSMRHVTQKEKTKAFLDLFKSVIINVERKNG